MNDLEQKNNTPPVSDSEPETRNKTYVLVYFLATISLGYCIYGILWRAVICSVLYFVLYNSIWSSSFAFFLFRGAKKFFSWKLILKMIFDFQGAKQMLLGFVKDLLGHLERVLENAATKSAWSLILSPFIFFVFLLFKDVNLWKFSAFVAVYFAVDLGGFVFARKRTLTPIFPWMIG